MADETDTTSEVARVLGEHSHYAPDARTQEELDGSNWECADCGHTFDVMFDDDPTRAMAAHQAAMLAEAGLLRAHDPDAECGVCGGTRDRAEVWRRKANRMDYALAEVMPTLRKIFVDATKNERQMLDAVDVLIEQARDGAKGAQIATQEPAEEAQDGSAGRGAAGGLGERLRALGTGQTRALRKELRAMADEADRLEDDLRFTADRANLSEGSYQQLMQDQERLRAQLVRMTRVSDEKTVRHGKALLRILDGAGVTTETEEAP